MLDNSLPLQPGRTHSVDLKATVVSTNGIREIEPEARGCFFTDESNLEFYKGYTFSNCRLECSILEAEEKYKCIPWYLPKVNFSVIMQSDDNEKGKKLEHLRSMDCEGLCWYHAGSICQMPPLPLRCPIIFKVPYFFFRCPIIIFHTFLDHGCMAPLQSLHWLAFTTISQKLFVAF